MKELSVEELSRVCGGGDNSFDGLAVNDIYESKEYPGVEYAKIAFLNHDGNSLVDFWMGKKDGNCIRMYKAYNMYPSDFRLMYDTTKKIVGLPWCYPDIP